MLNNIKNEACVGFLTADNLFEYVDPRINKGYGIEKVAKHFGVKLENCVAFGDEQNDREMLEKVGMGVCMKNGSQDVKECSACGMQPGLPDRRLRDTGLQKKDPLQTENIKKQ